MEDLKISQPTYSSNLCSSNNVKIETTDNPNLGFATCSHRQENGVKKKEADYNYVIKIEPLLEKENCSETLQNNAEKVNFILENANDLKNVQSIFETDDIDVVNAYDFISVDDKPIIKDEISELEMENPNINLATSSDKQVNGTVQTESVSEMIKKVNVVEGNAYDSVNDQSTSEKPDFVVKIKDEVMDEDNVPITNSEYPVKDIKRENHSGYTNHIVKSELEYPQDGLNCDDLLVPDYVRTYREHRSSTDNYGDAFESSSSNKLRTRSNSLLTTDNIVEVNCDIAQTNCTIDKRKNRTTIDNEQSKGRKILEPALSCEVCSYKTWNKDYMDLHKLIHQKEEEKDVYPCIICDYITKDKNSLTKHLLEHNGKEPFKCTVCEFKSNLPSGLLKHTNSEHPEITKPYSCNVCEYKSANNSAIVRHTRIHTGEKPFACKHCPYKGKDSSSLKFHMMQHTGEKPYSCDLCPYRSKCNSTLISHMRRHTGERPFQCNGCEYKFTNQSDLMQHVKINTGVKPFKCSVCEFSAPMKCALVKHVRTHTDKNTLTCEICMYKCTEKQILASHMKTHTGDSRYTCTNCDFLCLRKCDLLTHMKTHTEVKPFLCAHCDYKCRGSRTLANHVKKTHIEPSSKKIRIISNSILSTDNMVEENCDVTSTHSSNDKRKNPLTNDNEPPNKERKKHMNDSIGQDIDTKPCGDDGIDRHTEILEHALSCEVCSYTTWNQDYMDLHTLIHIKEEEKNVFPCIICDYITKDKKILVEHLISHNGKMPFRCIVCEIKCNTPSGLLKHNSSEHPEVTKPFVCNICEYQSSNNSALVRHTRIHTGEKPYVCKQCPYRCTDSSSLKYHMKQHTGDKPYKCNNTKFK